MLGRVNNIEEYLKMNPKYNFNRINQHLNNEELKVDQNKIKLDNQERNKRTKTYLDASNMSNLFTDDLDYKSDLSSPNALKEVESKGLIIEEEEDFFKDFDGKLSKVSNLEAKKFC